MSYIWGRSEQVLVASSRNMLDMHFLLWFTTILSLLKKLKCFFASVKVKEEASLEVNLNCLYRGNKNKDRRSAASRTAGAPAQPTRGGDTGARGG